MQDRLGNAPEGTPFTATEWDHLRPESRGWVVQAAEVMRQAAFLALASSRNSSRPPSSDSLRARANREKRRPSGRRPGGQPGQPGHPARRWVLSETPDSTVDLYPERCRRCDLELSKRDTVDKPLRHQVVEIKDFGHQVTEFRRHRCRCRRCRTRTTAELPIGVPTGLMGTQLLAFMALLVAFFRASRRRIRDFMSAAFGIELSVGLVDKGLKRGSESLALPVEEACERRKKTGVSYVDDTGWFEKNRAAHVWVNDTGDLVLYEITPSRDTVSAKAVIGEDFDGQVVSDRAGSFNWFPTERRQVCWAHLKRQGRSILEFFQQTLSAKDRGTERPFLLPGKSRDQPVRA